MDQVEVAGLRVAYRRAGQGAPLVLLHGGLGDSREWRRQLEGLADEFTVVAWDAPGCGGSSDPPAAWRLPDYADCLAGLIQVLELGRPHVGGLSWGGGLALELYRRHPQVPRSLVLASAYAGWAARCRPRSSKSAWSGPCARPSCRPSSGCPAGCRGCSATPCRRRWSRRRWR
jgi:pimeloyl-ACP methyl ester carboxylesterase